MALKDAAVRVVARACVTRVDAGEGTIEQVVNSYSMDATDREKVLAYVYTIRQDLQPAEQTTEA